MQSLIDLTMKQKTKVILISLSLILLVFANFALAADGGLVGCGTGAAKECTSIGQLVDVVIRIINYLLSLASIVAMIYVVWAGYQMVTAGGNEEKIATAKASFSDAIIGFFLILVSFVLLNAILSILGINGLKELYNFLPHS